MWWTWTTIHKQHYVLQTNIMGDTTIGTAGGLRPPTVTIIDVVAARSGEKYDLVGQSAATLPSMVDADSGGRVVSF